jgi:YesN/AraC family two-component response regulator
MKILLDQANIPYLRIQMGFVEFLQSVNEKTIEQFLSKNNFHWIKSKNEVIVAQIKIAVIELVHYANNNNSIIRNSDYLVEKIGFSYPYLSNLFAEYEDQTLEKYIIAHKIEKTKILLLSGEMSLSEIAFQMGYSSVQYLSNQFKKSTGITVSEFKKLKNPKIIPLDQI